MEIHQLTPAEKATYNRKIKTREELRDAIGSFPRKKKVIMCHGTFDLVHPGHIRHLIYAKSKGDILVASLTSDTHITKIRKELNWEPQIDFAEGVGRMIKNIEYWKQAPVWDTASIQEATRTWFAFMKE